MEIAIGFHGKQAFTTFMNIPPKLTRKQYKVNGKLHEVNVNDTIECCMAEKKITINALMD